MKARQRTLPMILFKGTLVVMLLYIALNYVPLSVAPIDAMRGEVEVGYIAARSAFGEGGLPVMKGDYRDG